MQQSPLYQEWQQEAELRGEQRGEQRGREQGRQEGRQEGRLEERQEVALILLAQGVPLETIALATKLTIEQLQQLQNNQRS